MRARLLPLFLLFLPVGVSAKGPKVLAGIDVLEAEGFRQLRGMKIGLITNQTGKNRKGRSTVDILAHAPLVELKAMFAPEHGFSGTAENFDVSSDTLRFPDGIEIPIYPSFGALKPPTADMLAGLDALVFDIQDVGARFYTYAAAMAMSMELAARNHVAFFVLDRPNPINGETVEGPLPDPELKAFMAYFQIPIRHGLTVGEIARLHNASAGLEAKLEVIPLKGWRRGMWYDQTGLPWTQPSPNMPDLDSAILYPGLACLEQTNLSVGRGTPLPFRWFGAPWLRPKEVLAILKNARLAGVKFEEQELVPTKWIHVGVRSPGIRIKVVDRDKVRPMDVFATIACALRDTHPQNFDLKWEGGIKPEERERHFFLPATRRLVGTDRFLKLFASGAGPDKLIELFNQDAYAFKKSRGPYLLY